MTPRQADADTHSADAGLFCEQLDNLLNQRHELYHLAGLIDWSEFDREGRFFNNAASRCTESWDAGQTKIYPE